MKTQFPGTLNVPAPGIPAVGEPVNALTEQVNNLQRRYYRSLAPDCELHSFSDKWYFGAILATCIGAEQKTPLSFCTSKYYPHICSDFHFEQADSTANIAVGIFYAHGLSYSSVPCGALMRPLPVQGGSQRGAELFLFPSRNNQHIVSF